MKKVLQVCSLLFLLAGCRAETAKSPASSNDMIEVSSSVSNSDSVLFVSFIDESNSILSTEFFLTTKSDDGIIVVGNIENPTSGGKTAGAIYKLPGSLENDLSGKNININVRARSKSSDLLRVAYSTNDVGNSGWKRFKLEPDFKDFSFNYLVKDMIRGRGDYLGFAPNGEVEIESIKITLN